MMLCVSQLLQPAWGFQPPPAPALRVRDTWGRAAGAAALTMAAGSEDGSRRIVVIGGGAAGFMGAIEAGRGLKGVEGAEVVLLEGTRKVRPYVCIHICMYTHMDMSVYGIRVDGRINQPFLRVCMHFRSCTRSASRAGAAATPCTTTASRRRRSQM